MNLNLYNHEQWLRKCTQISKAANGSITNEAVGDKIINEEEMAPDIIVFWDEQ